MIKNSSKKSEFDHFAKLANEWWDPYGKFKLIHSLTPIRMTYIKRMLSKEIHEINNFNKPLNKLNILDLGCGGGLICEPLARLGANLTGIDFIKQNITIAKKHAKDSSLNIKYLHQDLDFINLNKKYDAILILEVLEHVDDWKKIITNIKKYLKPKGKLILSTINRNLLSQIFAIYVAENILKWIPKKTHKLDKLIKPKELTSFLHKNNFNEIDLTGLVFKPISSQWYLNKKNNKINYFCTAVKFN